MSWSSKPRSRSRAARLIGALALCALAARGVVRADENPAGKPVEEYAVVVSPDVTSTGVSSSQLRRVFLFTERYWKPGAPIRVLLSDDGLQPNSFLLGTIYKMDYESFHRYVLTKLYQQEIDLAPKVVANDHLAVNFVNSGSRLISIVRADAARDGSARILPVDGKLPGSPGYALRK
jgi:hypothetical protein